MPMPTRRRSTTSATAACAPPPPGRRWPPAPTAATPSAPSRPPRKKPQRRRCNRPESPPARTVCDPRGSVRGRRKMRRAFALTLILLGLGAVPARAAAPPHLAAKGTTRQLIVDGRPFLILGGELGNSTASDLDALRPHWADFERLRLNTIVVPVSWELIE